jgi:hypothetical protein
MGVQLEGGGRGVEHVYWVPELGTSYLGLGTQSRTGYPVYGVRVRVRGTKIFEKIPTCDSFWSGENKNRKCGQVWNCLISLRKRLRQGKREERRGEEREGPRGRSRGFHNTNLKGASSNQQLFALSLALTRLSARYASSPEPKRQVQSLYAAALGR